MLDEAKTHGVVPPGPWVSGEMGTSEDDAPLFYVRGPDCTPLMVMTEGPDVCLCPNEAIACRIAALPDLMDACQEAAAQFDFYAEQHAAKGTPDADAKAEVNRAKAASMRAALARSTRPCA